ncbi:MAG: hypothetical protein WBA46_00075 [Thermomicrobiales bacterium]
METAPACGQRPGEQTESDEDQAGERVPDRVCHVETVILLALPRRSAYTGGPHSRQPAGWHAGELASSVRQGQRMTSIPNPIVTLIARHVAIASLVHER